MTGVKRVLLSGALALLVGGTFTACEEHQVCNKRGGGTERCWTIYVD